jgi:tetratricopeptide (TPR) repeat protein
MSRCHFLNAVCAMSLLFAPAVFADEGAEEAIQRGNAAYVRGHYQLAIFEYQAALGVVDRPHYVTARYNIGVCYFKQGRLHDAVREYRAAIAASDQRHVKAFYALGIALEELRQWGDAASAFTRAVELSGGRNPEALFELGFLCHRAGDFEAACGHYRKAAEQVTGIFPAALNNLGVALAALGRLSEAQQAFETALRQSKGRLVEAHQNLKVCRTLLLSPVREQLANLVIAGRTAAVGN